jgi:hypothetical protein
MNRWQIIRIALALAGIFAAGVLTGRFTAPPPPAPVIAEGANDGSEGGPVVISTGDRRAINSAQVTRFYTRMLKLTPVQQAAVIPLIRNTMYDLRDTDPGAPARLEGIRKLNAQVRLKLNTDQQTTFDAVIAEMEAHWLGKHGGGQ